MRTSTSQIYVSWELGPLFLGETQVRRAKKEGSDSKTCGSSEDHVASGSSHVRKDMNVAGSSPPDTSTSLNPKPRLPPPPHEGKI